MFLHKVEFIHSEVLLHIHVIVFQNRVNPFRCQFFVFLVGYVFYQVAKFLFHHIRQRNTEALFQNIAYAAFPGLAVDTDNIRIVGTAHIFRIDWQIWHRPGFQLFFLAVCHTFCDCILMRTGEGTEYQRTAVWLARMNLHTGYPFIYFGDAFHIMEVQLRVNAVGKHIHCQCDNVYIPGTFPVAEQCAFNTVGTG